MRNEENPLSATWSLALDNAPHDRTAEHEINEPRLISPPPRMLGGDNFPFRMGTHRAHSVLNRKLE
jgi:hypothetical protein